MLPRFEKRMHLPRILMIASLHMTATKLTRGSFLHSAQGVGFSHASFYENNILFFSNSLFAEFIKRNLQDDKLVNIVGYLAV